MSKGRQFENGLCELSPCGEHLEIATTRGAVDTYIQESVLFAKILGGTVPAEVVDFRGAVGTPRPTFQFGSGHAGVKTPRRLRWDSGEMLPSMR